MASTSSFLCSTEEDLTCPICLFLFIDPCVPKQLSCPHTYCKLCLEQLLPKSRPPIVRCPECRKCTKVPERNVSNLPTNVRLQSLAEKHKQHAEKRTEEDLTCPICLFLFIDPRVPKQLSCPHTYCKLCLEQLLPKSPRQPIVPCPECRKCTKVPERNVSNLPTNVRLQSLAEKHKQHAEKHTEEDLTCPICLFPFIDPRVPKQLSCPHTYCKLCLEQLLPKSPRPPIVPCPECRKCTKVPERNVSIPAY